MRIKVLIVMLCLLFQIPSWVYAKITVYSQGINVIVMMGPNDIRELGDKAAAQIETENKVVKDKLLQQRVDAAATAVGASYKHPVKILDSPEVNAFCTFDGRIYVTTGLLKLVSDDELCFVLAHETTHTVYNDPENYFENQLKAQIAFTNAGVEGALPNILLKIGEMSYSRDQERRADSGGVKDLISAHKDPQAAITLLQKLDKLHPSPTGLSRYFASHPPAQKRIQLITEQITEQAKYLAEQAKRLPPPATKFTHPGVKVLVLYIGQDVTAKPPKEIAYDCLFDELNTYLQSLGTFVFVEYREAIKTPPSTDIPKELSVAKTARIQYLVCLKVLEFKFKDHTKFFSRGRSSYSVQIKFQGTLYRVGDRKLLSDLTESFEYRSKEVKNSESEKTSREQQLAEAQFLTNLINKLLANE